MSEQLEVRIEPARTRRDLATIALLVALCTVPSLFTRDLWNPDEPRYTEVAREMVVLRDYLVPHLNGEVYAEKGPLFFWLTAALWELGAGFNSGRLVAMLAVLGTAVIIYLGFRRQLGARGALLAVAAALTTVLLVKFARRGVLDPLLMFTATAAIVAGFHALQPATRRRRLCWVACYASLALGVLNKGPVGLLVPALPLLAYGIAARREVRGGGWLHAVGALVLLAMVAAWVVPACVAGGREYAQTILVRQHVGRAVQSYSHRQPPWFFLLVGPPLLLPWTLLLPQAVAGAFRKWRDERTHVALLAAAWLLLPLVFFSIISGKRDCYIVPIAPAAGLLIAHYFTAEGLRRGRMLSAERRLMGIVFGVLLVLCGVLAVSAVVAGPLIDGGYVSRWSKVDPAEVAPFHGALPWPRAVLALALLALPAAACVRGLRTPHEQGMRRAALLAAAVLALGLTIDLVMTPIVNRVKSGRTLADEVVRRAEPGREIYLYGDNFSNLYNLYTGRVHMPYLAKAEHARLRELLAAPGTLIISQCGWLKNVLTEREQEDHIVYEERVGHRAMVVLAGRAPDTGGR